MNDHLCTLVWWYLSGHHCQRTIQLSPFILTLATSSILYHCWKGSGFKKGICRVVFMHWEPLSGGSSQCLSLSEGSGLPSSLLSPPSHLTASYLWKSLQVGNCRRNVQGCYNGRSISHLFGHLLLPLPIKPWTPQSPPQFHQGSSLSGSSSLLASSSSKCAKCTAGFIWSGWLPLSFLRGKKLVVLGLGGHQQFGFWSLGATLSNLPSQPPWQPLGSLSMSSPVDLPSGRLPLLLIVWGVHCISDPSSTLLHNLGESDQGRKWLKPEDALKGKCPSLTLFSYPQPAIGIAPSSAHHVLSHCIVFIQDCQHIFQGYIHTRAPY